MTKNLVSVRGDSIKIYLVFSLDGVPIDITGWTVYFTVKQNEDDPDSSAVISKTVTTHTDPTQGKTLIEVSADETYNLLGQYFYDVQSKNTDDEIKTPVFGSILFEKDVTRRGSSGYSGDSGFSG